ncbi:MAG: PDZ domain-containing protein [Blastocatellia bacterium]
MKRAVLWTITFLLALAGASHGQTGKLLLLQKPTLSKTHVAFAYAGDLWIVSREGGDAARLTTGTGVETDPIFSPDGSLIAFTGEYDGNVDVYVVAAGGGIPKRLTYHPGADVAVGWTADAKQVLFRSGRNSPFPVPRLFTMPVDGGFPAEVPLPMADSGSYSPDGTRLAYVPTTQWQQAWKRYRGGQTSPIWLANLSDSSVEKIPRENSNDSYPMWVGDRVYFLSDRNGPTTLFGYDIATKKVTQLIRNEGLDIKSASAGPGAIVYEQFGSLHLYDLNSGKARRLDVRIAGDMPGVRPRFEKVAARIASVGLSPTGARTVFEARGEILTVPAEKGSARNLTNTSGVAERDPAWSPDGKWIAYFSDESGEYELHLRDQTGMGNVRKINLGNPPSFYYSPTWSPDSKKIAYTDKRLNLWYVDLDKGAPVKVDTTAYENPWRVFDPVWSPDSRWLAYTKQLDNHLGAVFLYSPETGKSHQITDGLSDARFATFDKGGKYLYFTASTDIGPTTGWLDMSSFNHPVTRSVYVVVLRKDLPSPLAPESDEEKVQEAQKAADAAAQPGAGGDKPAEKKEPVTVTIDLDNIGQRVLALPIPARNYTGMEAGKAGILYLLEVAPGVGDLFGGGPQTLHKFELEKRKMDKVIEGINAFLLSANGEKMLYRQGQGWFIAATAQPIQPGQGALKLDEMEVYVDPRAEWDQMYREVWRIQRDFIYDPGLHGLDLKSAQAKYKPYVEAIAHRADLNYLFTEMLGELTVGHMFIGGGDAPAPRRVKGGLLGADFRAENGRYRFARIYNGENWNPGLRAPLTQPGVNVQAGEYLLAVNGREVRSADNVYSFFEGTAGKSVVIRVGPDPGGAGAREVTVVPVESETGLRNLAWVEDNRRKVDQMSGGRLAYVYLPNTAGEGYTNFNRYYFAQINKEGAVIDERFNGGGTAADYIIDYMRRPLMNYWQTREGKTFTTPVGSIFGPKAMIINEYAGSGGDALPWYFRKAGVGPLVGKRTWGGLVGIYDYPQLIDGGFVTAPRVAFWSPKGDWDVENHGVAPDIEVEYDPQAWRAGRDPQLEKAVEVVMDALKKNPLPRHERPAYPNYHNPNRASTSGR